MPYGIPSKPFIYEIPYISINHLWFSIIARHLWISINDLWNSIGDSWNSVNDLWNSINDLWNSINAYFRALRLAIFFKRSLQRERKLELFLPSFYRGTVNKTLFILLMQKEGKYTHAVVVATLAMKVPTARKMSQATNHWLTFIYLPSVEGE